MLKITFMGAGSTVFARNVLGDVMCTPALQECEIALYDIDGTRWMRASAFCPPSTRTSTRAGPSSSPIWEWRTARRPCGAPSLW